MKLIKTHMRKMTGIQKQQYNLERHHFQLIGNLKINL